MLLILSVYSYGPTFANMVVRFLVFIRISSSIGRLILLPGHMVLLSLMRVCYSGGHSFDTRTCGP